MTEFIKRNRSHVRLGRLAALALASCAFIGAACGSGEAANAVSGEEFASRVNALCEAEHEQVDLLFADFPEEPTAEDMRALVADFLPIVREYRDDVKAVGPPSGEEDTFDDYLALLDEMVERYDAASTDAAKAEQLFSDDDTRLPAIEKKLDLDVCASR